MCQRKKNSRSKEICIVNMYHKNLNMYHNHRFLLIKIFVKFCRFAANFLKISMSNSQSGLWKNPNGFDNTLLWIKKAPKEVSRFLGQTLLRPFDPKAV